MTLTLLLTAFTLGLRHGVDWDHIAAIADLSGTAATRRRGFMLSLVYALGHAAVVLALGMAAILVGAAIPAGLDTAMGYLVGITLIGLGAVVLVDVVRSGSEFRLRSRWMLVLDGTFAGLRAVRSRNGRRTIAVDHEHPHPHDASGPDHDSAPAHDHAHDLSVDVAADELAHSPELDAAVSSAAVSSAAVPADGGRFGWFGRTIGHRHHGESATSHSHAHRHEVVLPTDASAAAPGATVAAGIGVLHGVGFESPTQIAVFVAATSITGAVGGLTLLLAWVVGLVVANSGLALLAGAGILTAGGNTMIYRVIGAVVAAASIALGVMMLIGLDVLPELLT